MGEGEVDSMKGDVNHVKGDILTLKVLMKELTELKKGDSNDDVLNNNVNVCTELEKEAPLQHVNTKNEAEVKKEVEEVAQKNEKTIGSKAGIADETKKTVVKKGKKECVDIEEEVEEEKSPLPFIRYQVKSNMVFVQPIDVC